MRPFLFQLARFAVCFTAVVVSASAADQGGSRIPIISGRSYVGGSATVTVTGSFQVKEVIALNHQASFSDGEMTWLQYGASGAEAPNALITVSLDEVGVNVARGKQTATLSAADCAGKMDVATRLITGRYKCLGATSYDPRTGQMGKINVEIAFTAKS